VLLLPLSEAGLRARGFAYPGPQQFSFPNAFQMKQFTPDPALFWRLPPAAGGNSLGFPGPEPARPKPTGITRILFIGDSLMAQGYPLDAAAALNGQGLAVEGVLLALDGYSSHQGRAAVERFAPALDGDLAVVSFGWNDLAPAYGEPDGRKTLWGQPPLYDELRILQSLQLVGDAAAGANRPLAEPRVAPAEFTANLRAIADLAGVPVVFVTQPGEHAYNALTQDGARDAGAGLLDLSTEWAALPPEVQAALFLPDGVHFSPAGRAAAAERLAEYLAAWLAGQ
jgi:lysophospholipase L1-like esterase